MNTTINFTVPNSLITALIVLGTIYVLCCTVVYIFKMMMHHRHMSKQLDWYHVFYFIAGLGYAFLAYYLLHYLLVRG